MGATPVPFFKKLGFRLRVAAMTGLWIVLAVICVRQAIELRQEARFAFLLHSNGQVSTLQLETYSLSRAQVQPGDLLLTLEGKAFSADGARAFLKEHKTGDRVKLQVLRNQEPLDLETTLSRFTQNTYLILFFLPLVLAVLFFGFSIFMLLQRGAFRRARETVEVFSALCFGASCFFLLLLPTTTLALPFSFSILLPVFAVILGHLFAIYPKKKGGPWFRYGLLSISYIGAISLSVSRTMLWDRPEFTWIHEYNAWILGTAFLVSLACLGNTLFTSKDFWARRRARLLGTLYLISFFGSLSAFVAILWETPRVSVERVLAVAIFFPTAFALIFLKSNVFDLERLFRRALRQFVLLAMAATFALLVGIGWSEWGLSQEREWMLWLAIALVVLIVARPAAQWLERGVHRLIQTRVRYPNVNAIFERSKNLESFLKELFEVMERDLAMKNVTLKCSQDPTKPWSERNQEVWMFSDSQLVREFQKTQMRQYESFLIRGERAFGVIEFDGEDELAFDPSNSPDWAECVRQIGRCVELLMFQDFVLLQQGFLAVGRVQALIAHEMKNPLAIIKVCAGLLNDQLRGQTSDEVDELLRSIQGEVGRVTKSVQRLFDQPALEENPKDWVSVADLLEEVMELIKVRFPDRELVVTYWDQGKAFFSKSDADLKSFRVRVDVEGFRQALLNLIVNAFESGSAWVQVQVHRRRSKNIHIWVQDGGPGIPSDLDIFRPFVTTKPGGTGLGLAQVKTFADRNDAHVRVKSATGKGTLFSLEFGVTNV